MIFLLSKLLLEIFIILLFKIYFKIILNLILLNKIQFFKNFHLSLISLLW
jgi:hypothetical protein